MPSLAATARATIASRARLKVRRHAIAAAAMVVALHPGAQALPQGGVPTFGQTSVSTQGAQMTIVQGSNRAGIDWRSFSLGTGEGLNIVQPGANAILINRVVGADPSLILGNLRANGRVFLSNPRGVVFGKGSMVDVGSLVATTLNLSDAAMLGGRFELQATHGTPGELTQDGSIVASGTVALVAPRLTQLGSIQAPRIGLAAAERVNVDVEGDGLIFFNVGTNNLDTRLRQLGQLHASGGGLADIRAQARSGFADTVLNLEGVVQARGVTSKGGRIYVDGGTAGITDVRGTLDASSAATNGTGGSVTVLGDKVGLFDNAALSAGGPAGGGQVLVGGNWQGQGPQRNAQMTHVAAGVRIDASATGHGDGGTVVVWADNDTRFFGHIDASGGPASGNGGKVEVSGKNTLTFDGTVAFSSARGVGGLLLLDPSDITISTGANTAISGASPFQGSANTSVLNVTTLVTALNTGGFGTIVVDASGGAGGAANGGTITVANPTAAEHTMQPANINENSRLSLAACIRCRAQATRATTATTMTKAKSDRSGADSTTRGDKAEWSTETSSDLM
jgi:filamentous hemagglutinin family protein